ncbi:MAG: DinB family protein [Sphingobacteriales bacterium]|nr:MAG: DinB family protein [Sphingobacteriales bacterium]
MKSIKIILCALLFITVSFRNDAGLSDSERKYASGLMSESRQALLSMVKGLTAAQLAFKADTASWSVAECIEHIAITENGLFDYSQIALKSAADPSKRDSVKYTDQDVLKMITDRSSKFKAQDAVAPTGRFGSTQAALQAFTKSRDEHIAYVKTTSDDLRNHYNDFPFGKFDAFQTIIFMVGHCQRHTAQIAEIMQNPAFPKSKK